MRTEGLIFVGVAVFMAVIGTIYWFTSYEDAGTTLLATTLGLGLIPGGFLLYRTRRMASRPEDRPDATPGEGAGEVGTFPATSIWPLVLAGGATFAGIGLVFGLWAAIPGLLLIGLAFVGGALESRGTG